MRNNLGRFIKGFSIFQGRKHTPESKRKMRMSHLGQGKGIPKTEAVKLKISLANKNKYVSPETREKQSIAHLGKRPSKATRAKLSITHKGERNHMWGKHLSETHKLKISLGNIGKKQTVEARRKISMSNMGKKCSLETRKKISEILLKNRELNPSWKGGITPKNIIIRRGLEYKLWRTSVFERDNYTCIWCGTRSGNGKGTILNADHIKPFSLFPEIRFAIDNGRTLCIDCHRTTDTYGGKILKKSNTLIYPTDTKNLGS